MPVRIAFLHGGMRGSLRLRDQSQHCGLLVFELLSLRLLPLLLLLVELPGLAVNAGLRIADRVVLAEREAPRRNHIPKLLAMLDRRASFRFSESRLCSVNSGLVADL